MTSRTEAGARRTTCRCGAPVLRQLVGRRAALDVTADAAPMPAPEAAALREDNRLDWCLRYPAGGGPDLRWADCHRARDPCPYPHVIDHQCTGPAAPRTPRTTRKTPAVPDGQLTLGAPQ
ncbi:hypothetical protein [Streptomyces sp. B15]|uniref:hypothetical protein n=1 Tax=Streptomyces sp. B15 TaxID=1537797 RepID=UPI001B376019|nr:hypothetical protein [Streptomyces sp. B15]MBQ1122606.1 hypothetical protein [Streptomyces sp. B15]